MAPKVDRVELEREIITLEAKKEMYFAKIGRIYNYINDLSDETTLRSFRAEFHTIDKALSNFKTTVEAINDINLRLDENYSPNFQALDSAEQLCGHIYEAHQQMSFSDKSEKIVFPRSVPHLPKIDLVEFHGDKKHWPLFYESFKSLIDSNKELDDSTKIHYLLGSLKGKALDICAGILPTAANYQIILKTLKDRFEDKRLLANTYLSQIMEFKAVQNESAACLNMFLEKFDTAVSALKNLKLNDLADYVLVFVALSKLDCQTHKYFEMSRDSTQLPKYDELVQFIKNQSLTLSHSLKLNNPVFAKLNNTSFNRKFSKPTSASFDRKLPHSFVTNDSCSSRKVHSDLPVNIVCPVCSQGHVVNRCPEFIKNTPNGRYKLAKEKLLCLNCLSTKHRIAACKSVNTCNVCRKQHHTLLHFDRPPVSSPLPQKMSSAVNSEQTPPEPSGDCGTIQSFCSASTDAKQQTSFITLLSTVVVNVISAFGETRQARFLLDTASQSNFITSRFCSKLGLPIRKGHLSVLGIGSQSQSVIGCTEFVIASRFNSNIKFDMNALVIGKITDHLPCSAIHLEKLGYLQNLQLADDSFYKPGEIEGIIGAEIFPFIIGRNKICDTENMPVAVQTSLGYVIMGKAPVWENAEISQTFCSIVQPSVEKLLQKFWEIEEVTAPSFLNQDDVICEQLFVETTTRDSSGRYSVALPFRENPPVLGNSLDMALRRFMFLEKRFRIDPTFKENYSSVINDYLAQSHMSLISKNISNQSAYYIPHFAVLKDSRSTPLRIVFDCSAKSSNSRSLNDTLYQGEKLQTNVVEILLNFRLFEIAIISDIRQMYRNINVHYNDRRYQCILWRSSPDEPLCTYQLNTVTFGLKPSPFLALRTIKQLCIDEGVNFPSAAKVVESDIYVDDVTTSIDSLEKAKLLYSELVGLFNAGGFELVKWATNSKELLAIIPGNTRACEQIEFSDTSDITAALKVLGLKWNPETDSFSFVVNVPASKCTKRNILSSIARIWDPLGLLSPVTLFAKLLIKELWLAKIDWDDCPPAHIEEAWIEFYKQIPLLEQFRVPRYIGMKENISNVSVLGFADASLKGLAAVVYLRIVTPDNQIKVNVLCSKAKVSPLKSLTIPRLELCASYLLAKLLKFVLDSYSKRIAIDSIYAFTDSTVTLNWIKNSPHKWTTFVANRVAKIQSLVADANWYHIDGKQNPADCLSRGLTPSQFVSHTFWVSGPLWLREPRNCWPIHELDDCAFEVQETKVVALPTAMENYDNVMYSLIQRISSFAKLRRIVVYVLRFLRMLPRKNLIEFNDLGKAERVIVHVIQKKYFVDEFRLLEKNKLCSSALRSLSPFIDPEGLLRVGGRLRKAPIDFDHQHPLLLPKKDHFVDVLIDHYHSKNLHTGPHLLLSILRQKYWILSARSIVRKRIQLCNYCFKYKPKHLVPYMADLPKIRVTEAKPFLNVGVDYGGPFYITLTRRRGVKSQKAYLCLFICLATKAVHLELAPDLSTAAFLNCFKRFLARRGPCKTIHSDCGTNFIGAKTELDQIYKFLHSEMYKNSLVDESTFDKIEWKFNPPASPHFGGIWESNIKMVKSSLYKVIGNQILTYEELTTVLIQIESLLNSRPLCWLSSDPSEPAALTPAHFLTLTPLQSLPAVDVTERNSNLLSRKELLDKIVQSYWKRWRLEYLSSLQSRLKWNTHCCPARKDMVVVIRQDNVPPLHWPIGVIVDVFPGQDGTARVALVKTKTGIYKRPVIRLCPLPNQ